jgi:RNA polymerase sigma factor (sigma-70 family)
MNDDSRDRDRTLLDHLSCGRADVFWTLWKYHEPHLTAICRSQMRWAREDAEDAISRSMLLARAKLPVYAAEIIDLEAWLTRLVCNVCSDMKKERCRATRRARELDDDSLTRREASLPEPLDPEQATMSAQILVIIRSAIAALPSRLRAAAYLRLVHNASYPDIAERLGITEPNARKRVQQAREVLRGNLMMFRPTQGGANGMN